MVILTILCPQSEPINTEPSFILPSGGLEHLIKLVYENTPFMILSTVMAAWIYLIPVIGFPLMCTHNNIISRHMALHLSSWVVLHVLKVLHRLSTGRPITGPELATLLEVLVSAANEGSLAEVNVMVYCRARRLY